MVDLTNIGSSDLDEDDDIYVEVRIPDLGHSKWYFFNDSIDSDDTEQFEIELELPENTEKTDNNTLGATFKNKSKVINIMSKQKHIAENKKGYLLEQKNKTDLEIAKIIIQKDKIENKAHNKKLEFDEFQDLKLEIANRNIKKD